MDPSLSLPTNSQIETFLEHHYRAVLQHIALMCRGITVKEMKARSETGWYAFLPRPSAKYYGELVLWVESSISEVWEVLLPDERGGCGGFGSGNFLECQTSPKVYL
ncbi:unnamed protein product [Closterium sp. Yama58-4]|nr:unnamed protein product [Closterium sp. Yama58-4]